ncbi:MAG: nodulation protein NfeD, partial [Anaerolineae bacterium]|nr:nodulation protein NfeD [Anaerolineae bacterium]
IEEADLINAEALVIRLDTPGGSIDLTQDIIRVMVASDVPIVVYVWPPGGFAASAGTFVTLAASVAAMAPNTSIGAASPISADGTEVNETLQAKVENILVAEITGLAERRGEDALEWAKEAITEAKAATANEALELGVIDIVAQDLDDLLLQLDGRTVEIRGESITLSTADAPVTFLEPTSLEELLSVLANPSIALLLVSIGSLAVLYEIINPGGYMSGIVGAILLLIGFYGIGQLPVNFAGLALIILAIGLFVAELFTTTFGALTAGGIVAFILGGLLLFNTEEFAYQLPLTSLIGIPVSMAFVISFGLYKVVQSRKTQAITGAEGLIGSTGTVKVALDPQGTVLVWGERWQATSADGTPIPVGQRVEITERDGFRLKVKAVRN